MRDNEEYGRMGDNEEYGRMGDNEEYGRVLKEMIDNWKITKGN